MTPEKAQVWHDYPMGGKPTKCCGRTRQELALNAAMTTDQKRVTCDGTTEPLLMAHEVYPHPSDMHDQPPTVEAAVKYHLARCLALYPAGSVIDSDRVEWMDRINLYLGERHIACLMIALHKGLSGQEAVNDAHAWSCGDDAELVYDLAEQYGVDLHRIKPYGLRTRPGSQV